MTCWFSGPGQEAHFDLEVGGCRAEAGPTEGKAAQVGTAENGSGGIRVIGDYKQVKARAGGYREQG